MQVKCYSLWSGTQLTEKEKEELKKLDVIRTNLHTKITTDVIKDNEMLSNGVYESVRRGIALMMEKDYLYDNENNKYIEDKIEAKEDKKYGCLMIHLPKDITNDILKFGKDNIKNEDLYKENGDKYGLEYDLHITIKYGIEEKNGDEIFKFCNKPIKIKLGEIFRFSNEDQSYDVLNVKIISDDLIKLNKEIDDNFKHITTFEYQPHCCIGYVKKGKCKELDGNDIFKGKEFILTDYFYSNADKDKFYNKVKPISANDDIIDKINDILTNNIENDIYKYNVSDKEKRTIQISSSIEEICKLIGIKVVTKFSGSWGSESAYVSFYFRGFDIGNQYVISGHTNYKRDYINIDTNDDIKEIGIQIYNIIKDAIKYILSEENLKYYEEDEKKEAQLIYNKFYNSINNNAKKIKATELDGYWIDTNVQNYEKAVNEIDTSHAEWALNNGYEGVSKESIELEEYDISEVIRNYPELVAIRNIKGKYETVYTFTAKNIEKFEKAKKLFIEYLYNQGIISGIDEEIKYDVYYIRDNNIKSNYMSTPVMDNPEEKNYSQDTYNMVNLDNVNTYLYDDNFINQIADILQSKGFKKPADMYELKTQLEQIVNEGLLKEPNHSTSNSPFNFEDIDLKNFINILK
jgi:hypothetical protein